MDIMQKPRCIIDWTLNDPAVWAQHFAGIRRANLLQSYDYARAAAPLRRQKGSWGLIEIDSVPAGLVQVLEAGIIGNILQAAVLDRGPLWFDGFGNPDHCAEFLKALRRKYPARPGRKLRFIPEWPDTPELRAALNREGFRIMPGKPYATIWVDLTKSEEDLRAALRGNWRGHLNKAEKSGLTVIWEENLQNYPALIRAYAQDRAAKEYDGPSVKLMNALAATFGQSGNILIGRAVNGGQDLAYILLLRHGSAATYQIGWASEAGKKTDAHTLLLWNAMLLLKAKGYKDFDLGGINDEGAHGVKTFKQGLGGDSVSLSGLYIG